MNKLSIFTLSSIAMAFSPVASAVDFGLGATFKSNEATIYLPITSNNLLIEPSIRYGRSNEEVEVLPSVTSDGQRINEIVEVAEIGLGVFIDSDIQESFKLYYGARTGYIKQKNNQKNTTLQNGITHSNTKADGFFIQPTIGISYAFTERSSLALESGVKVAQLKGSTDRATRATHSSFIFNESLNTKKTVSTTETNIVLRHMF
jgi:hypothetical protein